MPLEEDTVKDLVRSTFEQLWFGPVLDTTIPLAVGNAVAVTGGCSELLESKEDDTNLNSSAVIPDDDRSSTDIAAQKGATLLVKSDPAIDAARQMVAVLRSCGAGSWSWMVHMV